MNVRWLFYAIECEREKWEYKVIKINGHLITVSSFKLNSELQEHSVILLKDSQDKTPRPKWNERQIFLLSSLISTRYSYKWLLTHFHPLSLSLARIIALTPNLMIIHVWCKQTSM